MRYIKTITCENCGKVFESTAYNAVFCCRRCAKQNYDAKQKELSRCEYNFGVDCSRKNCESCGWHPMVAQERLNKIWAKMMADAENE